jgi:Arrestin (or S-antigen), N-terminal domain
MVNFQISLERDEYAAGETAKGTLVISADENFKLRGFEFYVCGLENTDITLVKQYVMQTPPIPRTYRESDVFFYEDLSTFILKSIGNIVKFDNGTTLKVPQGVWKVPFEFSIPKYAYMSYNGKNVSIIYGVIVRADKAWRKDINTEAYFTVFNPNRLPIDDNMKDWWGTDIKIEKEGIKARLYLQDNKNIFSPGDTIKGNLTVENFSGKRISNAKIILSGMESVSASDNSKTSTIEAYEQKVEFKEGDNSVLFEIQIPKEVNRSYRAVYSKYYWEIALKLDISGSRDLETWTNIQIV